MIDNIKPELKNLETLKTWIPLSHSIYVKRNPKFTGNTIKLIEHEQYEECTGTITGISPNGNLAKEGYSIGQNIMFKQLYEGVKPSKLDENIMVKDEYVYAKYRATDNNKLIIIPRKGYIFGETIVEEKSGRIYLPEGIKNNKKEFTFKVKALPLDFPYKHSVFGGDILNFSASKRMKCVSLYHNRIEYLFMPIKELDCVLY